MDKTITYTKNTGIALASFFVLLVGILAICGVLELASWADIKEWLLKAAIVFAIVFIINIVIGVILNTVRK